ARGAHRDADVGDGEDGSVVDAVADHEDGPFGQAGDGRDLLLGEEGRTDLVDADLGGDVLRGGLGVAREHDDVLDADAPKGCEDGGGLVADGVGELDDADTLAVDGDVHGDGSRGDVALGGERVVGAGRVDLRVGRRRLDDPRALAD